MGVLSWLVCACVCASGMSFNGRCSLAPAEEKAHASLSGPQIKDLYDKAIQTQGLEPFHDEYFLYPYFFNLRTNFPLNSHGSCGYVAASMLLSFYDTYWDDDIIPEAYDKLSTFDENRFPGADFDLIPFSAESPGVTSEAEENVANLTADEYMRFCENNADTYFQSRLLSLRSNDIARDGFGLTGEETERLLDSYFRDVLQWPESRFSIERFEGSSDSQFERMLIERIQQGQPMLLVVENPALKMMHSVIAYDYDSISGSIFVHTGWKDELAGTALAHCALRDISFDRIHSAIAIDIYSPLNLGLHYAALDGSLYNASHFIFPQDIEVLDYYADDTPVFTWKSLYREKWYREVKSSFQVSISDLSGKLYFRFSDLSTSVLPLSDGDWEGIRIQMPGQEFQVVVRLLNKGGEESFFWDEYWWQQTFEKPKKTWECPIIHPADYGYLDAYPVDEMTKTRFVTHQAGDFTFETRRYRAGYIQKEAIVLSPIREGIHEAFLEFRFPCAVSRLDINLSFWRGVETEYLTSENGTLQIEQFVERKWVPIADLFHLDNQITTNRKNPSTYRFDFNPYAYRVRIRATYTGEDIDSRNRGRLCIGNIVVHETKYGMPLSGDEKDYNPKEWRICPKDGEASNATCYSYAMNAKTNPKTWSNIPMIIGQSGTSVDNGNATILSEKVFKDPELLVDLVRKDAQAYSFRFERINKDVAASSGCYKVALFIDDEKGPGTSSLDYHWYRQNSDGTWSHKPGVTAVTNKDPFGHLIYDPVESDRNFGNGKIFEVFAGWFEVSPIDKK